MKTKKEIEKALENCKSIRTAKKPKKSLCPLYPGEPICMNCTFSSAIEWILGEWEIDECFHVNLRDEKISKECLKEVFKLDKFLYGQVIDKTHLRIIKDLKLLYNYNWIDPETITRLFGKEGIDKCDILVSARRMEKKDGKYRIISSPAKRRKSMGVAPK
jgi:hypothetical protein